MVFLVATYTAESIAIIIGSLTIQCMGYCRCAVVGSGMGLMTGRKYGGEIDSHSFVIRFNEAPAYKVRLT